MISASSYIRIMATFNCQHLKTLKLCGHVQRKASYHDWLHYQSTQATKKLLNLSEATDVHHGVYTQKVYTSEKAVSAICRQKIQA